MRGDCVKLVEDLLRGGLADDKKIEDIAKMHEVPVDEIKKQYDIGVKIEKGHTNDINIASEIALDHLHELPDYYSRLVDMEKTAKDELEAAPKQEEKPEEEEDEK